jgi:hypothetical protein
MKHEDPLESRIDKALKYAVAHNLSSLMNNTKWYKVFEFISHPKTMFEIELLGTGERRSSDWILELEGAMVMVDYGGFITFAEIHKLRLPVRDDLRGFLEETQLAYEEDNEQLVIYGYR